MQARPERRGEFPGRIRGLFRQETKEPASMRQEQLPGVTSPSDIAVPGGLCTNRTRLPAHQRLDGNLPMPLPRGRTVELSLCITPLAEPARDAIRTEGFSSSRCRDHPAARRTGGIVLTADRGNHRVVHPLSSAGTYDSSLLFFHCSNTSDAPQVCPGTVAESRAGDLSRVGISRFLPDFDSNSQQQQTDLSQC